MKTKRFAAFATAAAIMLGVAGCAGNTTSSTEESGTDVSSATSETKELEEVSVVLDWYPNGSHVFLYDAIEEGYYAEEGLKVKVEFPSNTNDAISSFIKAASLKRSVYLGLPLCFFRKAALMGKYFQARRRVATSW